MGPSHPEVSRRCYHSVKNSGVASVLLVLLGCLATSSADINAHEDAAIKPFDYYVARRLQVLPTCGANAHWNAIPARTCFKRKNSDPGQGSGCNAGDVTASGITTVGVPYKYDPSTNAKTPLAAEPCCPGAAGPCYKCTEGDTIGVSLSFSVVSTAKTRYKVSAWFGSPWIVGSNTCTLNSFDPASTGSSDGTCCGGLEQGTIYPITLNDIRFTCTSGGAAAQCVNQKLEYSFTWDNQPAESPCTPNVPDVTGGVSYANLRVDQPKCLDAAPVPLNTIVVKPNTVTPLLDPTKAASLDGGAPCSSPPCTVAQQTNFYWLVSVPIKSGRTIDYLTLEDDGLPANTGVSNLGPTAVQWSYTAPDGTTTAYAACEPTVTPSISPTKFSCKTTTGTYTGGTFTFRVPTNSLTANGPVINTARAIATAGTTTWKSSDASATIVVQPNAPTPPQLTITKTAKVNGGADCPATVGNVCNLPQGTFAFTYVMTGTVVTTGTPPVGPLKTLTIVDTYPANLPVGALTCSTKLPGQNPGSDCTCSVVAGKPTCTTTIPGWPIGSQIVMNIAVTAPPQDGAYLNVAVMSVVTADDKTASSLPVDHQLTTSVVPPTPAFEVSKVAYRADKSTVCGSDPQTCILTEGESFWWLVKARVTAGTYTVFSITDTLDAKFFITDPAQNVAICSGTAGKVNDQNVPPAGGSTYACSVTSNTPLVVGDYVQLFIPAKAAAGSASPSIPNTATVTGSQPSPPVTVTVNAAVAVIAKVLPTLAAEKVAVDLTGNLICPGNPAVCNLPAGLTDFKYRLTTSVATSGAPPAGFSSLTIADAALPNGVTASAITCTTLKGGVSGADCSCVLATLTCTTNAGPGAYLKDDKIVALITVKAVITSTPYTNVAATSGTPVNGNPIMGPTATEVVQTTPVIVIPCDASISKTVTTNPVYVGGSSQPPTTSVITTISVQAGSMCDQVKLVDTLQAGLSLTSFLVGSDHCSASGNSGQYTCIWAAVAGPATFTVQTLLTVTVGAADAPTSLTDTGVIGPDDNPNNNKAVATINVLPVTAPVLRITKTGPGDQIPVNQPFPFYVSAGVANGVAVTELTLTEQLTGVDGAYFVEWPVPACTPATASKPTLLNCKWTGSVIPDLNNLKFVVIATKAGTVINTATVSSPGATPKPATANAVICDTATCPTTPALAQITKTVNTNGQPYVAPGAVFTYTIVAKLIQGSATSLAVFDYVDPAVTFTAIVAPATGCSLSAHAVTCQVAPGTTITLNATADTIGTFVNTAQVSVGTTLNQTTVNVTVWRPTCGDVTFGGVNDPFSGCPPGTYDPNFADQYPPSVINCCNLNPQDVPTMKILKVSSADNVSPGQTVDWTISVENQPGLTPVTAESVQVIDTLPAGVRPDPSSVVITGGTSADKCTFSGRQITCNLNSMAAGTVKFIKVTVTVLKVSVKKTLTNTATVTCKVAEQDNPACKDTTSDDIIVTPLPPQTVLVNIVKTATPQSGPKNTVFTFRIVVQPAETGKTATNVVLTDSISKDLKNVKLLTPLGGKCSFDQSSYVLTCNWSQLKNKQTVRIKVTGVKPGPTTNTAVVTFTGGKASSSADIMVNADPLGSCCDGSYTCSDGITQADCKAKGAGAIWSDWTVTPPVTCASSTFCKGACCSSGVGNCKCPYCHQTSKSECSQTNDKWVPGADCNNPSTCPSQCTSKCQSCSGPGDNSCCPGLACVCSGNKFGPKYVCASINPYDPGNTWIYITSNTAGTSPNSVNKIVKTNLFAPVYGPCGRTAAGLQCKGPAVDCVLDGSSETGRCLIRSTLRQPGESCTRPGQCVGGYRCLGNTCKQATCPKQSNCAAGDFKCLSDYTFGCQAFWAHTMSSFDDTV